MYELITREISGKATKKAYKELYNKEYLKNIEEKEVEIPLGSGTAQIARILKDNNIIRSRYDNYLSFISEVKK